VSAEAAPRRLAKAVAGSLLRTAVRLSRRHVGVALLYHSVEDSQRHADDVLVPGPSAALFARQLDHLRRRYRVVPPSQLQEAAARRRRGGRIPVAITFDDDDPGYTTTVLPLLRRAGLTAAFFLNGSSLERPTPLWWRQLQAAWDHGAVGTDLLESLPRAPAPGLRGLGATITALRPEQRARVSRALTQSVGSAPDLCGPSPAQVRELADAGLEIGFHTRGHDYLPLLTEAELEAALVDGRELLEKAAGRPVVGFAYPSGGTGPEVRDAVHAAGYRTAFTTEPRPVSPGDDPLALGRISPPTGNVAQLSLALARTAAQPVR